jgi:rubrerythrin
MDIFDQAMAIERQGEALYRSVARDASDKGVIYIFSWLADQEKKHYDVLKNMKEDGLAPVGQSFDLKGIRGIFLNWKETRARIDVKTPQVDLYRQALDIEEKTVKLYEEGARTAADNVTKAAFLSIAAEEKVHRQIVENIIEFITKPDFWAENAEFGYRGEDYYL